MALKQIVPPASPAVALDYVKTKLRVEHDEDNVMLESLILAAIGYAEGPLGFTARALVDQTWDLFLDAFPVNQIEIPLPPLIEVLGVFYLDSAGAEQTFDPGSYAVDTASEPGRVVLGANVSWPTLKATANAVRVRFRAGYLDDGVSPPVDVVPQDIQMAIFMRVFADYAGGDAAERLRSVSENMLRQKRVHLSLA